MKQNGKNILENLSIRLAAYSVLLSKKNTGSFNRVPILRHNVPNKLKCSSATPVVRLSDSLI